MTDRTGGKREYHWGRAVTITVPEAVAEQVADTIGEIFGHGSPASRRARPARASEERLSPERIVDVAIEQMREHGYDAVTMRSIAKSLGTGPASLYAHVANRAELDQLVVGRVSSQWQLPDPDPERWDAQIRDALQDLLDLLRAHPGVARCSLGMIPSTAATMLPMERLLAILRAGGVPDQYAAWFVDIASLFVAAVAVEEDIWRERGEDPAADPDQLTEDQVTAKVRQMFASLPAEHFPTLHALAVPLTTGTAAERFDFGAGLLVGGLRALAEAESR